jgi:hypothetical protein
MSEPITLPPATAPIVVTEPDIYHHMPEAVYHGDPVPGGSLSSTGARKLIPPSCPAKFRWWLDHPEPPRAVFEFGSAAHQLVLGTGPELMEVEADDWRTKAAKEARDQAREGGLIPLLSADYAAVHTMAAELREHPIAGPLLDPDRGYAEVSLFWRDGPVWGRARLDKLTATRSGRPVIADYKTAASAAPEDVEKAIARYGYHVQGAHYVAGAQALNIASEDIGYVLVFQEKEPPYLVTVAEPHPLSMRLGARRVRQAFDLYAECQASGVWPGYGDGVIYPELPAWETRELNGQVW